jgi:hypothetical protein
MIPLGMRTIGLNNLIKLPVSGSEGCESTNQWGGLSDSLLLMPPFRIYSISAGTWLELGIIGI